MSPNVQDWLNLLVRWFHLVAGISWIGSSFYFMWLDKSLEPPEPGDERCTGRLWMVHSGGFYEVKKKKIAPGEMPETLHWFKWEAALTWISGMALLTIVFYMGGGIYLVDPAVSRIDPRAAAAIGLGLLLASWFLYDTLCNSALAGRPGVLAAIGFGLVAAAAFGLSQVLSGRAAYMHVGAILGTLMVANVWMRILPAQQQMIDATARGETPDYSLGERAKLRSVHNNYMTFPVLFIMLSNHFPSTYGHRLNWLVLVGLIAVGAAVRHVMNARSAARGLMLVPALGVLAALVVMTSPAGPGGDAAAHEPEPVVAAGGGEPVDPATAGAIRGVVRFEGPAPDAAEIQLPAECAGGHGGPVYDAHVLARDGRLENVFVWIRTGLEGKRFPPPEGEVVIDQRGCMYEPHVLGVRVGQPVTFVNDDAVTHNVNARGKQNAGFNESMPPVRGTRLTRKFMKPEIMVRARCDVHPWMSAFVGVLPHPCFAVTGVKGEFALEGVPPGEYVLEAWHETLGTRTQKVTLAAKGEVRIEFAFAAK